MCLIAGLTLFIFTGCQKTKNEYEVAEDIVVTTEDTTQVVSATVDMDSASNASNANSTTTSNNKLLDKISISTEKINPVKGSYTLSGTKWRLKELRGKAVNNTLRKEYTLTLNSTTGKFTTYVGCNSFTGNYLMKDAGLLSFSMVVGTEMACPNMDFENDYINALIKVNNYMVDGNMLHLHKGNRVFAMFEASK